MDNGEKMRVLKRSSQGWKKRENILALKERDRFTNLFNERGVESRFDVFISGAKRRDERVVLVYFDLDGFKLVNDKFGHDMGDNVILCVAETLKPKDSKKLLIREDDLVSRPHATGDEFMLVLSGKFMRGDEDITAILERIEGKIKKNAQVLAPEILDDTGFGVSAGYSWWSEGKDYKSLRNEADKKMLEVKNQRHGR